MATFGGATFTALARTNTRRGAEAAVSVRHIPGSDTSVIDLGGRRAGSISVPVLFDNESQFQALRALSGTQASLDIGNGAVPAILVSVNASQEHVNLQWFGTAEFVIL